MFRPTPPLARRGTMLVVVLLLLTLFSIIGVVLAYYTSALAERMRMTGEAAGGSGSDFPDDGSAAMKAYLASLIYPLDENDPRSLINAARGHDLTRTMYGFYGTGTAWDGIGTFHELASSYGYAGLTSDRARLVNHTAIMMGGQPLLLDPEFTGVRPRTNSTTFDVFPTQGGTRTYVPKNPPYTYPDLKDLYLAAISPATGEVLVPSYHRPWLWNGNMIPPSPTTGLGGNPNWTNAQGRLFTLRPRPIDNFMVADASGKLVPQFPYVPANTDGTYTGDVQNLPGGVGPQKNDSLWMDIGLPAFNWNGRRIKALVAPLVVDLNSRLDLNSHGDQMNGGVDSSMSGFGQWETSFGPVIGVGAGTDGQTLINARGAPRTQSGVTSRAFNRFAPPGVPLPQYSSVAWGGVPSSFQLPGQAANTLYNVSPTYGAGFDSTNNPVNFHAALFNPNEWPAQANGSSPRTYQLADTKFLSLRYAFAPSMYSTSQLDLASLQPLNSLRGTPSGYQFPTSPITAAKLSNYRLDPAHANRLLFTTRSYGLDLPGLMPNFRNNAQGNALVWDQNVGLINPYTTSNAYPDQNTQLGSLTDFDTTGNGGAWRNASLKQYGAIDLNTPLTDYRTNTNAPLSPGNVGNFQQAWLDRQRLAMKIFQRLVIATGAQGQPATDPTTGENYVVGMPTDPTQPEFKALRQLAQMAANFVDAIDNDDISTAFVWNPKTVADQLNGENFVAAELPNRVVFGVEKPRLVLNEAYSEVTNDPSDQAFSNAQTTASKPAHIRFWLELQNPTAAPYANNNTNGPMGDGSVKLLDTSGNTSYSVYRIEIVRSSKGTPSVSTLLRSPATPGSQENVTGGFGVQPDVIFDFSTATQPTIPTANGNPDKGMVVCAADFPGHANNTPKDEFGDPTSLGTVPASVPVIQAKPPSGGTDTLTYTLPLPPGTGDQEALDPNGTGFATGVQQHVVALRRLANPYLPPNDPNGGSFNPSSPANPYITVDYMDYVQANDALYLPSGVKIGKIRKVKSYPPNSNTFQAGYDPVTPNSNPATDQILRRASVGKVQPYAGYAFGAIPVPSGQTLLDFTFPSSMVLRANPTGWSSNWAKNTFGRNNSIGASAPSAATYNPGPPATLTNNETLMAPFDWMIHYDRPLINQLELLPLHAGKPHELTFNFILPNSTTNPNGVKKYAGAAPWLPTPAAGQSTVNNNALYRALELLRVAPDGYQMAFGGRLPGRININTIQDKRIFQALFDSQQPGGVPGNFFSQADIDALWSGANGLIINTTGGGRTNNSAAGKTLANGTPVTVPQPGPTVYDNANGTGDRPFLPFGVAESIPNTNNPVPFALGGGSGIDDTILRRNPPSYSGQTPGPPRIWVPNAPNVADPNPYLQSEAARKILNNVTTVSHTFAVYVTVGFFEVFNENSPPANWPSVTVLVNGQPTVQQVPYPGLLGKEVYQVVPGDLRQKFFAIVDRSNLAPILPAPGNQSLPKPPVFTTLEANVAAGQANTTIQIATAAANVVYSDGTAVTLPATLYIGQPGGLASLANNLLQPGTAERVTVTGVQGFANGVTTLKIQGSGQNGGLLNSYSAGVCVSNVRPGGQVQLVPNQNPLYQVVNLSSLKILPGSVPFDYNATQFKPVVPYVSPKTP